MIDGSIYITYNGFGWRLYCARKAMFAHGLMMQGGHASDRFLMCLMADVGKVAPLFSASWGDSCWDEFFCSLEII